MLFSSRGRSSIPLLLTRDVRGGIAEQIWYFDNHNIGDLVFHGIRYTFFHTTRNDRTSVVHSLNVFFSVMGVMR